MTLAETQALFQEILVDTGPLAPQRVESCFAGTAGLPAAERVGIYANMYVWRLVDALRETFPNVARYLGGERFAVLGEAYVRKHPSEHHDVARVGRRLAAFLRHYPDAERPDLADLAELEWARNEVFFAPPVEPIAADALAPLSPESFVRASLLLSPALRVLSQGHAATSLWRHLEHGEPPDPPSPCASTVVVWRSGFEVLHCDVPVDEAAALRSAAAGDTLTEVCASFADRHDAAADAHAALSSWFDEGWIVAVSNHLSGEAHVSLGIEARGLAGGISASSGLAGVLR